METRTLDIDLIDINARMRDVDESKVTTLAQSMAELGLLNPIIVHCPNDETLNLIAGAHRLRAAQKLGWTSIACALMDGDDLHAQLAEIDENLMRSELTATQQAEHLQRRKEVWEAMKEANNATACRETPGRPEGFAGATERATGTDRRTTQRATRRAREVCQEARDLIRGTDADTGAFLDQLAKLDDAEQVEQAQARLDEIARRAEEAERAKADKELRDRLRAEKQERERIAKERKQDAKAELCNYLFERTRANEWGCLIDLMERAGWSAQADVLRNWETPASRVA